MDFGIVEALKTLWATTKDPEPTVPTNDNNNFFDADMDADDVKLQKIIDYLRRDAKFQYVVYTLMGYSVGAGFNNTTNTDIPSGRKCLELINDFAEDWNLDEINQLMAIDGWSSGNGFLNTVPSNEDVQGIYHIGMGTIKDIITTPEGEVKFYVQKTKSGFETKVEPEKIAHFKWLPINESAFGEGIGQVMSRKGVGYKTSSGKVIHRQSYFEIAEMFTDIDSKLFYSGIPRYVTTPDNAEKGFSEDEMSSINSAFEKLNPLQNITMPQKTTTTEIALSSRSNFQSLIDRFDKEYSVATKTPLIELTSSLDFSYASSQTALKTMLPLLGSFQRAYKRFIEKSIYEPIIANAGKNPKIINARINWGVQEKLTVDQIVQIQSILNQPDLVDKHNPEDIVNMLIEEVGVPLPLTEVLIGKSQQQTNLIHRLEEVSDNRTKMQEVIRQFKKNKSYKEQSKTTKQK